MIEALHGRSGEAQPSPMIKDSLTRKQEIEMWTWNARISV
jgi:hypothetical protein